uniref:SWIM-type domain-containing protein n=1 Tax=Tanacetum cinerariifolium TaxID=118510 RepID=A0A6L2LD22_TANCI|nr:hypothetical protein [Tanacetum cinerariifolium]
MVVKLGYGVVDLMYYHFLIPRLGLDYDLHHLNVDADVLEMAKYVKDYKIILVYVEHGRSIFVAPKNGVAIAVDNYLRKGLVEIDSSPDVNRNLTQMKILSKKQPASSVEGPIVVESADDPFEDLDEILVQKVKVEADNESKEESNTKENYTSGSDSDDSNYDPNHDEVFDDDEHIVEDVHYVVNIDTRVCSCKKWELTRIPCKHVVAAIYNMSENSMGVAIPNKGFMLLTDLKHKHMYTHSRPPKKKKKKSNDKITSQSASSGKLSRKGKSIKCGRKVSGQAAGAKKASSKSGGSSQAGARKVSGQAAGKRKASSQSGGSSQPSASQSTTTGARSTSSQAVGASQPSAAPSTANQGPTQHSAGPRQGFQEPRAAPTSRS